MKNSYELGHFVRAAVYKNLKAQMARQNLDSWSSFFLPAKHDMDMRWEREGSSPDPNAPRSGVGAITNSLLKTTHNHRQIISTYIHH